MGSYKDKLVGAIPGAFAQAFGFDCSMQEDVESDDEEEAVQDGNIRIGFSKEEKVRMRAPWQKALIIKTFGRRMAFSFLVERVRKMWNPCGGMDCIDLGYDYFLVRFELAEDVDSILTGDKPLIRKIYLGKIPQCVLYEGINALCFSCGRIGHKLESCPFTIREQPKEHNVERNDGQDEVNNNQGGDKPKEDDALQENYGEWMVVSRRKTLNKAKSIQRSPVLSQASDNTTTQDSNGSMDVSKVAEQSRRDSKRKSPHTQPVASQVESYRKATSNLSHPNVGKGAKGKGVRTKASQRVTDLIGLQPAGVGPSKKDGPFVFGSDALHSPFRFSSTVNPFTNPKDKLTSTETENNIVVLSSSCDGRKGEVGNLLQGEDYSGEQRDYSSDKTRPNRNLGLVRTRFDVGVEELSSADGKKQTAGVSAIEERGMVHNPESMVEVPEGSSSKPRATGDKLKNISNRIRRAELGKISGRSGGGVDEGRDLGKNDVAEELGGMLVDGQYAQGKDDPVCGARDKGHDSCQGNPRGFGDNQACSDSLQGVLGVEGGDIGGVL
nr:hypothetical protein CFP56_45072 [Quercus suber]